MNKNRIKDKIKRFQQLCTYTQHYRFNRNVPESVYFYTFHKCASTLFSKYVLKNVNGLYNIDYANQMYYGIRKADSELTFKKRGFIYGPIRISSDLNAPIGKLLVTPTTEPDFIRDKIALFFVRDPRDILVSSYYSFGFTHGLSKVDDIREHQKKIKGSIQGKTLDEYVLESTERQKDYFETLYNLSVVCERSLILRYEDMINDFDSFTEQLRKYLSLEDPVIQGIYQRSRPKQTEDTSSHRRSGQVQGFRDKLQETTIKAVNKKLAGILTLFGYEI